MSPTVNARTVQFFNEDSGEHETFLPGELDYAEAPKAVQDNPQIWVNQDDPNPGEELQAPDDKSAKVDDSSATEFDPPENEEELRALTVSQLRALAAEEEVDLEGASKKDDIVQKILDDGYFG